MTDHSRGEWFRGEDILPSWGNHRVVAAGEFVELAKGWLDIDRLTLALEVTAACSLRCPGCWVSMLERGTDGSNSLEKMTPELFEASLNLGRMLGTGRVSLLGGEPTLHPDLPALIQRSREMGFEVSVTTNGVVSRSRLSRILRSGVNGVSFSLDGSCAAIHDRLRPSPNGRSTFDTTLRSLKEAVCHRRRFGYRVTVNHTIFRTNIDDAEAMIRLSVGMGVDAVRLHFTLPGDFPEPDGAITFINPSRWMALRERTRELSDELGVPIQVVKGYRGREGTKGTKRRSPYLNIRFNGEIVLCSAYARIRDPDLRVFGRLLPTGELLINNESACLGSENGCCGALSQVCRHYPTSLRQMIQDAGGLGCIILDGPLVEPS